jgi:DNA invertase Pin-like site-specific DNA recombinase
MRIGYARVSSDAQDHAAQIEALKAAGCERVHAEKISGATGQSSGQLTGAVPRVLIAPGDKSSP